MCVVKVLKVHPSDTLWGRTIIVIETENEKLKKNHFEAPGPLIFLHKIFDYRNYSSENVQIWSFRVKPQVQIPYQVGKFFPDSYEIIVMIQPKP